MGNTPQTAFDPKHTPASRTKNDARKSRESAGALIYSLQNKEQFVLIGKETNDALWNFMRGNVEAGDSYLMTALNELNEETGGIYRTTEAVLMSESYDVYEENATYACTFFVEFEYRSAEILVEAVKNQTSMKFKEMNDYRWIRLSDLKRALTSGNPKFSATTVAGVSEPFAFREHSFRALIQAERKGILDHLP